MDSLPGRGVFNTFSPILCYDSRNLQKAQHDFYGPLGDGPRFRECPASAGTSREFPKKVPRFLSVFELGLAFGPVAHSFLLSAA
jgi:hypothetical protein